MSTPGNILVIRLSSLGDVLMCMPAVKAIRDRFPDAGITWLVEGPVGELLAFQTFIDKVMQFPRGRLQNGLKAGDLPGAAREIKGFLARLRKDRYDCIVDFHGIIKSAFISACARGGRKVGFDAMHAKEQSHLFYGERVRGTDRRMHKVEKNMLVARYLGAGDAVPEVLLEVPDDIKRYVDNFFHHAGIQPPVFAVNPFSSKGTDFKRWPIERYAQLIGRVRGRMGASTLILWGPGEKKEAERLQAMAGEGAFLACPTNIPQLYAMLEKVDMYIGGDTGVMHLAAAAKIPVVAIFGPTDVKINAPYGLNNVIVRKEISCSPCKKKDCRERTCIESISVEDVFEAVKRMSDKTG
ncbi:MAG TPA: glycosyltransferase family 9 protein [Syntrophorhabdaceae bacterium]|nr:glycosyltransferase family 9 protein [Syntrophorhabdaceae bacterium]